MFYIIIGKIVVYTYWVNVPNITCGCSASEETISRPERCPFSDAGFEKLMFPLQCTYTVAFPCLGPLAATGVVGAHHDGILHRPSPVLRLCVVYGVGLCEGLASRLRCDLCCQPTASSSPCFDCSLKCHFG